MNKSCALLLLALLASPALADCDSGTAILVRHGEKTLSGDAEKDRDAPLSAEGRERAQTLAAMFEDAGIDAVFSSPYQRTRGTAEPVAAKLNLEVQVVSVTEKDASARLAARVMAELCGREALIVGHSDTLPELLRAFGAEGREIPDQQYDNLFVVHWRRGGPAQTLALHYGRPTP